MIIRCAYIEKSIILTLTVLSRADDGNEMVDSTIVDLPVANVSLLVFAGK